MLSAMLIQYPATASSVLLRQKIVRKCREDIYHFLNHENGQIAIYDAVNPLASGRRSLAKEFAKHDIEVQQDTPSVLTGTEWRLRFLSRHFLLSPGATTNVLSRKMSAGSKSHPQTYVNSNDATTKMN